MKKTYIADLPKAIGEVVTLNGWVYNKRSSGKIWFLILRDGTGYTQCVVVKGVVPDNVFNLEADLTHESSLSITGLVKEEPRAIEGYELEVKHIEVYQLADEYPISKKEHGTAFLMDNRHLWLRSRKQHAILKIRHEIIRACRDFFDNNGFVLVDTPIFTANVCEPRHFLKPNILEELLISPRAVSYTMKQLQWLLARRIALVQPSGLKNRRPGDI